MLSKIFRAWCFVNIEMWGIKIIMGYSAHLSFFVVGIVNQNQSETVVYVQHPITL